MSAVQIQFDKPRSLKFDLAAIKDLEAAMNGQPLGTIVGQLSQLGITAITLALWAGLKAEDRALTPNLVLKMLQSYLDSGGKLSTLTNALSDAIESSGLFNVEDGLEGNEQATQAAVS